VNTLSASTSLKTPLDVAALEVVSVLPPAV
jgi:hypothetical protein